MPFLGRSKLLTPVIALFAANGEVRDIEEEVDDQIGIVIDGIERFLVDDLEVSDDLVEAIHQEEGQVLTVYRDVSGLPTVGAGHLVTPEDGLKVGDRISERQMREFLRKDLKKAEEGVRKIARRTPLTQHEYDALVDLTYNVGPGNVSDRKSPRLNEALRKRDYRRVAQELTYSKAQDGRRAGGLVNRSERRRRIFERGDYGDPREL